MIVFKKLSELHYVLEYSHHMTVFENIMSFTTLCARIQSFVYSTDTAHSRIWEFVFEIFFIFIKSENARIHLFYVARSLQKKVFRIFTFADSQVAAAAVARTNKTIMGWL